MLASLLTSNATLTGGNALAVLASGSVGCSRGVTLDAVSVRMIATDKDMARSAATTPAAHEAPFSDAARPPLGIAICSHCIAKGIVPIISSELKVRCAQAWTSSLAIPPLIRESRAAVSRRGRNGAMHCRTAVRCAVRVTRRAAAFSLPVSVPALAGEAPTLHRGCVFGTSDHSDPDDMADSLSAFRSVPTEPGQISSDAPSRTGRRIRERRLAGICDEGYPSRRSGPSTEWTPSAQVQPWWACGESRP